MNTYVSREKSSAKLSALPVKPKAAQTMQKTAHETSSAAMSMTVDTQLEPDSMGKKSWGAIAANIAQTLSPETSSETLGVADGAVNGLTSGLVVQRKMTLGEAGDRYEAEADRLAPQIVNQINAPALGDTTPTNSTATAPIVQLKAHRPTLQLNNENAGSILPPAIESAIHRAQGGGQPLAADLQLSMGQAMGADFSGVRVHTGSHSNQLNQSIQARAFTTGQDVFFRQGAYQPNSHHGQQLIAHELAHVIQQTQNRGRMTGQIGERKGNQNSLVQRVPADFNNSMVMGLNKGSSKFAAFFLGETPWSRLKTSVNQYSALAPGDRVQRTNLLQQIRNNVQAWNIHHNIAHKSEEDLAKHEKTKVRAIDQLQHLVAVELAELQGEDQAVAKLGRFTQVGEGYMTSTNMVGTNFSLPPSPANQPLNQRIAYWATEGFGNPGQHATDLDALNRIFQINAPVDANRYANELRIAYRNLAGSKASVGRRLAELLGRNNYTITLDDARDGTHPQKQVDLKLIAAPGIPSQFLTPWEQGLTIEQSIDAPAALSAVLMWDPQTLFSFYKPRTPADAAKAENDHTRRGDLESMDPWVVLAHEIGHFEDFLTQPMDFYQELMAGNIGAIEGWNLPREQALVRADLNKIPRTYYQDFPGTQNEAFLGQ